MLFWHKSLEFFLIIIQMLSGRKSWSMWCHFFPRLFHFILFNDLFKLLFRIVLYIIKTLILAKFLSILFRFSPFGLWVDFSSSLGHLLQSGSEFLILLSLFLKYYLLRFRHFKMLIMYLNFFGAVIFMNLHKCLFWWFLAQVAFSFFFVKSDYLFVWIALRTGYERCVAGSFFVGSDETLFT